MTGAGEPPSSPRCREEDLRSWIFGEEDSRRFTQDSAVLPRVWLDFAAAPDEPHDLLLTPEQSSSASVLARDVAAGLDRSERLRARLAYNESYVAVRVTLRELLRLVVPLSSWWSEEIGRRPIANVGTWISRHRRTLRRELADRSVPIGPSVQHRELIWFVGLVGRVGLDGRDGDAAPEVDAVIDRARELLDGVPARPAKRHPLWCVNPNRKARTTVQRSRPAIKADAAARLFKIGCDTLCWGIIDAGVDATHPAFGKRDPRTGRLVKPGSALHSRVRRTYDFTRLRGLMCGERKAPSEAQAALDQLEWRLAHGHAIDWDALEPLLRVSHEPGGYEVPAGEHGTHVAGIIGADWRAAEDMPRREDLTGICPDIGLFDLRVLDEANAGWEFPITAALQFVRHLNAHSDLQIVHGVNVSLAIPHDVRNYACGRTPVCDECDRLVQSGVVVVASAGNDGRAQYVSEDGVSEGYRTTSITDPGNAERVLTVGATHRYAPHTYGVSYFSSRGPTGDGRKKPDLVAPGERIYSTVPGVDVKAKDGTSQAAPHVSGAAALLMARHEELRAQPERVKRLLCSTATDLGRDRDFQGAGMLDVLRAIQEV